MSIKIRECVEAKCSVLTVEGKEHHVIPQLAAEIERLQACERALLVAETIFAQKACYACSRGYPLNEAGTHHEHEGGVGECSRFTSPDLTAIAAAKGGGS